MLQPHDFSPEEQRLMDELEALTASLREPDGLLTPGLPLHVLRDRYARPTRQIGDHNMNFEHP